MEKWEKYLTNTKEKNYNIEHLDSVQQNNNKLIYESVMRSLAILDSKKVDKSVYYYVSETLKWMDVSKTGSKEDRRRWKKLGYDLYIHNIASSMISKERLFI